MSVSENQLKIWAKAPSESEETKCQNAVNSITNAIRAKFGNQVTIFLQGSYKNRTNIKLDSDVDIVVRHDGFYFPDINWLSDQDKDIYKASFVSSNYTYSQFKTDIQRILESQFGQLEVLRKNKCIKVNGNSYRVNADVIPCFVHNRYSNPTTISAKGIELISDSNDRVCSFPDQHYENGVQKNSETRQMFKPIVRILKRTRNELAEQGEIEIEKMPSFFLESLVWNVLPHTHFHKNTYKEAALTVSSAIWGDMRDTSKSNNYAEVSNLMWLFKGQNKRIPQHAFEFIDKTWDFIK